MEKCSEIRSAIEELSMVVKVKTGEDHDAAVHVINHDSAHIPTRPFLSVCNSILQVLGQFFFSFFFFSTFYPYLFNSLLNYDLALWVCIIYVFFFSNHLMA